MTHRIPPWSLAVALLLAPTAISQCATPSGGTAQTVADDSISTVTLSHPFPFPGGVTTTTIGIDSNGRVYPNGGDVSDFTPSVAEFLGDPHPTIAPLWSDFSVPRRRTG